MVARLFQDAVDQFLPRGWRLVEIAPPNCEGACYYSRKTICCKPVISRETLAVFLHEVGHATNSGHGYSLPEWLQEYEADIFAVKAMAALGVPMPRKLLRLWKWQVGELICSSEEAVDDERVLRYAFGREWRQYR